MADRPDPLAGARAALPDEAMIDAVLDRDATADLSAPYARVARLLAALTGPASEAELAGEADAVAAFVAVRQGATPLRRGRLRSARLASAGALVAGLVLAGAGAAAATGSLPGPVQQGVSQVLDHVGLSVPGDGEPSRPPHPTVSGGVAGATQPVGPSRPAAEGAAVTADTASAKGAGRPDQPASPGGSQSDSKSQAVDQKGPYGGSTKHAGGASEGQTTPSGPAGPAGDPGHGNDSAHGAGMPPAQPGQSSDAHDQDSRSKRSA